MSGHSRQFQVRTPLSQPREDMHDLSSRRHHFLADAIAGLGGMPKRLPSKYFYDARGSALFEAITEQPEYYLTRVEMQLLQDCLPDLAKRVGPCPHVVELGPGSGTKTGLLLEALDRTVAYTAMDISEDALADTASRLAERFPGIEMFQACADFTHPVPLPQPRLNPARRLIFFPGSTLGNFHEDEAVRLLSSMRRMMLPSGYGLIGLDQVKDPAVLEAAYNDAAGLTSDFTLNLLVRLNDELGADFDLDAFFHRAVYSAARERIETAIVSRTAQTVTLRDRHFSFRPGEEIQVEISQKYTDASFESLARKAGLAVEHTWNDAGRAFALTLVRPSGDIHDAP